jgi:predicted HicB family RNase H-like nuclease
MNKTKTAAKFIVRLPDGMRERLAKLAEREERSMNGEFIVALRRHLEANGL